MSIYSLVRPAVRKVAVKCLEEFFPTPAQQDSGVIFSHSNGTEPNKPYVTVNILNVEQQGHGSTSSLTNTDEELSVNVSYEVMVQYSFFGSTAGDMAMHFNQRINNSPVVLEEAARNKLGFMRKSQLRRNPQKRDTQWIDSYNMDVTYSYIANTQQIVDVIEVAIMEDALTEDVFTVPPGIVLP